MQTTFLDTVAPSITFSTPAVTTTRVIAITVGGTDGASGARISRYAVVEGANAPAVDRTGWVVSPPSTLEVSVGDGSKTVTAFTRDVAGFVSVASSQVVTLQSPP